MKKILLFLPFLFSTTLWAQNGLEGIIVERYYVSDSNDTAADLDGGTLPIRSVTYRIYVDMLPGYKFQAAYGVDVLPVGGPDPGDHELRFATTTLFFNNEDRGATSPTYTKTQARSNTLMLDSWLSVGAGCAGNFGVLKSEDDSVATVVNNYVPPVLQNSDSTVGIPLTVQDGLLAGIPESVTFVGFTPAQLAVFDNTQSDSVFSTWDASWASLNGSMGPDSLTNKVLIAQLTTDGDFEFWLNVQIGTPVGGVENYVHDTPVGTEIQMLDLHQQFFGIPSGVASVQQASPFELQVYPNPTGSTATVQIKTERTSRDNWINVYDVTGHKVMNVPMEAISGRHNQPVDVTSLAPGLYILEVDLDGSTSRKPFVKQ